MLQNKQYFQIMPVLSSQKLLFVLTLKIILNALICLPTFSLYNYHYSVAQTLLVKGRTQFHTKEKKCLAVIPSRTHNIITQCPSSTQPFYITSTTIFSDNTTNSPRLFSKERCRFFSFSLSFVLIIIVELCKVEKTIWHSFVSFKSNLKIKFL